MNLGFRRTRKIRTAPAAEHRSGFHIRASLLVNGLILVAANRDGRAH
jgi:hypothetical protein